MLVSEDEVEGFSFPFEGRREDQTFLAKVRYFGRAPSFAFDRKLSSMIVSFLPCLEEEEDGQELSPLAKRERSLLLVNREINKALSFLEKLGRRLF